MIKTIMTPNKAEHDRMVEEAITEGYSVTEVQGQLFGFSYRSLMHKDDPIKLTRAEILQKARDSKKLKSEGGGDEQEEA